MADDIRSILSTRLQDIENRLRAACDRAGRRREDVVVVAVTKNAPDAVLPILPDLGLTILGENRPQELWRKSALVPAISSIVWHLIGHLQRNKIERTLPLVGLVHSVDSLRLLEALEEAARTRSRDVDVLLEFNTSGETSKGGFAAEQIEQMKTILSKLDRVRACGLMTMAAQSDDPERARPCFAFLRSLRESLKSASSSRHPLTHLSMGMSGDFEVAVEEGATLVRIGSALFEGLSG